MFDIFELFVSLLLKYELTVMNLLFLDLNETFFPFPPLDDVSTTTICLNFYLKCLSTIKIKLEI